MTANNITVFKKDPPGKYINDPSLTISGGMNAPTGILIDNDGVLYVMSYLGGNILSYTKDRSGKYMPNPAKNISKGICGPSTGFIDADGTMYITNFNNNSVAVLTKNAEGNYAVDESKTISGNLIKPVGLGITPGGVMYVTNYGNKIITAFSKDKTGIFKFDGSRTLETKKVGDYAIRIHDDLLFISDYNNNCVDIYAKTKDGYRVLAKTISQDINQPTDQAFDKNGNLYVFNYEANSIVVFVPQP